MIKINLSPRGAAKSSSSGSSSESFLGGLFRSRDSSVNSFQTSATTWIGILKIILLIVIPVGLFIYEEIHMPQLQDEIQKKQAILKELKVFNDKAKNAVSEIKKFKEDEKNIQDRISVLNEISKKRFLEIQIIDLLQQITPGMIWMDRLEISDKNVSFDGFAANDLEISAFMEALNKSAFLSDVSLTSSKETIVEGIKIKKFSIVCLLDHGRGS